MRLRPARRGKGRKMEGRAGKGNEGNEKYERDGRKHPLPNKFLVTALPKTELFLRSFQYYLYASASYRLLF